VFHTKFLSTKHNKTPVWKSVDTQLPHSVPPAFFSPSVPFPVRFLFPPVAVVPSVPSVVPVCPVGSWLLRSCSFVSFLPSVRSFRSFRSFNKMVTFPQEKETGRDWLEDNESHIKTQMTTRRHIPVRGNQSGRTNHTWQPVHLFTYNFYSCNLDTRNRVYWSK